MKKICSLFRNEDGQALVETLVILPLLILMLWGIYYSHAISFLSVKAEMAARHAAWVGSRKEYNAGSFLGGGVIDRSFAISRGQLILSGDGMWNDKYISKKFNESSSGSSYDNIRTNGYIFIDNKPFLAIDDLINKAIDNYLGDLLGDSLGGAVKALAKGITGFASAILSALPLGRCFFQNSYAEVSFAVETPLFEIAEIKASAFFPNRWEDLYFHNLWDFFDLSAVAFLDGLLNTIEDVNKLLEDSMEDYNDAMDDAEDDMDGDEDLPYDYDDLDKYLDPWRNLMAFF